MDGIEIKDKVVSVESAKIIYDSLLRYITAETNIYTTDESWTTESVIVSYDAILTQDSSTLRPGDLVVCKTSDLYKIDSIVANDITLKSTGISLRGKDGLDGQTPVFSVGTVQTLTAGSAATVTITGTQQNPIINFGIPRGASGASTEGGGGEDGISPVINVTEIENGHRITITDVNGTQNFDVFDGESAVSPTITTEDIDGGYKLIITDVNGSKSIDIMHGESNDNGAPSTITIDTEMSDSSANTVQNRVIKKYVDEKIDTLIGDIESAVSQITSIIGGE